jgi:hypothetical protein
MKAAPSFSASLAANVDLPELVTPTTAILWRWNPFIGWTEDYNSRVTFCKFIEVDDA